MLAGTKIRVLKKSVASKVKRPEDIPVTKEFEELANIEDVRAGDYVLSWNEKSKKTGYAQVLNTFVRKTDLIYTLKAGKDSLETTWNHPFWVVSSEAERIANGEQRIGASLSSLLIIKNYTVESDIKGHWVQAKDLRAGDTVMKSDGTLLKIESIKSEKRTEIVYNFEVAGNHTYFVGEEGVLVHNADYGSLDWKRKSGESSSKYVKRMADEMRSMNENITFTTQEEQDMHIAETAKVWGEKFAGLFQWGWVYQFIDVDGKFKEPVVPARNAYTGIDCTNFVAGVLYSSGVVDHTLVPFKNSTQPAENFATDGFMSEDGKKAYLRENPQPCCDYPTAVARLRNSDLLFEKVKQPSIGNIVTEDSYNYKTGKPYAAHAMIIYDKYQKIVGNSSITYYKIAEMPGSRGASTKQEIPEDLLRKNPKYTILKLKVKK